MCASALLRGRASSVGWPRGEYCWGIVSNRVLKFSSDSLATILKSSELTARIANTKKDGHTTRVDLPGHPGRGCSSYLLRMMHAVVAVSPTCMFSDSNTLRRREIVYKGSEMPQYPTTFPFPCSTHPSALNTSHNGAHPRSRTFRGSD